MQSKSLYIIRHAKAEEFSFDKTDFKRSLIDQGIKRAGEHALILKQEFTNHDDKILIVSSTAKRAAQTAQIFAGIIEYPESKIQWCPAIYEAHYLEILKNINNISANYNQVLVFGHNPGLSDLISYISDQFVNLKTANIACLKVVEGLDYSTLSANTANLNKLIGE